MTVYLDSSALVKLYLDEPGSADVSGLLARTGPAVTVLIARVEVAAALARAVRLGRVAGPGADRALEALGADWENIVRVKVTEALAARAAGLAWEHGLRGYDAVHLAAALAFHEASGEEVVLAAYDRELCEVARRVGLRVWPEDG